MKTSPLGLAFIRRWEGCNATVYADAGGKPTVGIGHLVVPEDNLSLGDTVTQAQIDAFLARDLWAAETHVSPCGALLQHEFDALVSLVFNIGTAAFEGSTLLRRLLSGDKAGAAEQFAAWHLVNGKAMPGLDHRRAAEKRLFLTGAYTADEAEQPPAPVEEQSSNAISSNAIQSQEMDMAEQTQDGSTTDWVGVLAGGIGAAVGAATGPLGIALGPLAAAVVRSFEPLAQQHIAAVVNRHTDNPQVGQSIAATLLQNIAQATGQTDPIQAVAHATARDPATGALANPQIVAQVQQSVLDTLDKMAPVLDRLAQQDQAQWSVETAGRDAAAKRAQGERWDMTQTLVYFSGFMTSGMVAAILAVILRQVWLGHEPSTALVGLGGPLFMAALVSWKEIFAYRFDGTKESSAKDAIIGEMAKRK